MQQVAPFLHSIFFFLNPYDLKSVALVSPSWTLPAQAALFNNVQISTLDSAQLLLASPSLRKFPTSVLHLSAYRIAPGRRIWTDSEATTPLDLPLEYLAPILDAMHGLKDLILSGWENLDPMILCCPSLSELRSLDVADMTFTALGRFGTHNFQILQSVIGVNQETNDDSWPWPLEMLYELVSWAPGEIDVLLPTERLLTDIPGVTGRIQRLVVAPASRGINLSAFPALRSLTLVGAWTTRSFKTTLQYLPPYVTHMSIEWNGQESDWEVLEKYYVRRRVETSRRRLLELPDLSEQDLMALPEGRGLIEACQAHDVTLQ